MESKNCTVICNWKIGDYWYWYYDYSVENENDKTTNCTIVCFLPPTTTETTIATTPPPNSTATIVTDSKECDYDERRVNH